MRAMQQGMRRGLVTMLAGSWGWNNNSGTISACYATGDATGADNVGGLVGSSTGTISACYATGDASGNDGVGGLVGFSTGTISACYATGNASGTNNVGGLVGSGAATNSYFDSTVSNRTDSDPYAKTTTDLQTPTVYDDNVDATDGSSIYEAWNIDVDDGLAVGVDDGTAAGDSDTDDPWDFGTDSEYPALKVDFDRDGTATADEFGSQRTTHFLSIQYMFSVVLGISAGSEVGTVVAVPADFNNTLSYSILSQTLNGAAVSHFVIANTAIGTISVADPAPTEVGIYTLSVEVSDGAGGTATTEVIINLYLPLLMSGGEVTTCSDKFTDTGGESGNYGNNEDITMTISPESAADRVRVEFTSFHVEANNSCAYDRLEVYNGATTSAPLIGTYCGTNSPGVLLSNRAGGKLTFRFQSDGSDVYSGWEATISCVPAVPASPPAAPTALTAAVTNTAVTLSWDVPVNDGGAEITGYMIEYSVNADLSSPTTVTTTDAATSYTVSGLTNATPYYFRVAAVNSAGTGAYYPGMGDAAVSATPADNLIDVTTLEQLNAIRYDLDGDGVVSFTTADPLPAAADFSNRTAVVTLMGADSIYAQAFTSGDFYTAADGIAAATGAVAVSTTYYYKLSSAATSPYIGYELMSNLDFEDANGDGTADDKSIWAEGASGAGVPDAVAEGWAFIGYYTSSTDNAPYTATFDGRGHTISNLYINRPSTSRVGLFGDLGTGSNVRNLGIVGGSLSGASPGWWARGTEWWHNKCLLCNGECDEWS